MLVPFGSWILLKLSKKKKIYTLKNCFHTDLKIRTSVTRYSQGFT